MKNEVGTMGEIAAARYLRRKGYQILTTNYHSRFGEIDIIADDRGTVVFVEVKTRVSSTFARPMEYVDYQKQQKIIRTALCFLAAQKLDCPCRFDVIEVYLEDRQRLRSQKLHHIKGAFAAE